MMDYISWTLTAVYALIICALLLDGLIGAFNSSHITFWSRLTHVPKHYGECRKLRGAGYVGQHVRPSRFMRLRSGLLVQSNPS